MRLLCRQILDTLDVVRFREPTVQVREIKDNRRVVCINLPDQPFIVDSVRMHLKQLGAQTVTGFNVIVGLKRNESGQVIAVDEPAFSVGKHFTLRIRRRLQQYC